MLGGLPPRLRGVLIGVLAAGFLTTVLAASRIKAEIEAAAQREFAFACNEVRLNITDRLASCAQILHSGAAFLETSAAVSRETWRAYIQHLQLEQQLPGIQGVGFALWVPREQLARHVQSVRAEGFPDYSVRPAGAREQYSAIIYIEPFADRNLRAFGYDMLSEPVRRAALERARDENAPALSGKVTLVQETDRDVQAGTLLFVPVYRQGAPHETPAQRRAALQGWIYSPYRMTDLMRGTLRGWEREAQGHRLCLQVYDGESLAADTLLYDSQTAGAPAASAPLTRLIPLDFAGRRWTLSLTLPSGLAATIDYRSVWLVGCGGTIINLLVFWLTLALFHTRSQARRLRDSAETYRALFVDSPDACLLLEQDMIVDCNRGAELLLRGQRQQLIGQPLARFSPPPLPDGRPPPTAASAILSAARRAGHPTCEWVQRRLDGSEFPAEVSLAALTLQGRPAVFAAVRDSTTRKQAAQRLLQSEERYRLLTESLKDVVWTLNAETLRFIYISPSVERLRGYTPEEIIAAPLTQALTPEAAEDLIALIQGRAAALRSGQLSPDTFYSNEVEQPRKDGSTVWTEVITSYYLNRDSGCVEVRGVTRDITERKRAEADLHAAEALSRQKTALIKSIMESPQGVIIFALDTAYRYTEFTTTHSAVMRQIWGVEIAAGMNMLEVISDPSDRAKAQHNFDRTLRGEALLIEEQYGDDALTRNYYENRYSPIFDSSGAVKGLTVFVIDVSPRKQAEELLRTRELKYRRIFENIQDVYYEVTLEGLLEEISPSITALSRGQFAREDLLGKSIYDFYAAPRSRETLLQVLREKGSVTDYLIDLKNRDGSLIPCSLSARLLSDVTGQPHNIAGTLRDISARKQAEQVLQLQGAALAAAANAIIITDIRGTIEWANPAYCTLTGYALKEVLGKNPRDLVKSGVQTAAFYQDLWTTILAGRVWHGELVNRRKDGSLYTEETTITPVHNDAGEISDLISIKQDITDQKEMKLQLLRSQRLESVGRLAGGVAHDLNNILSPVLLAAPLLRAAHRAPDSQELLDVIETSARRGADIIRQLLTFSRGLKGERFPLQPGLLVREIFTLMRETFPKNIKVRSQLPDAIENVTGDATQLHQVLMNLCVNARDAMPAGGVLTVSLEPVTLDAAAAAAIPGAGPGRFVVLGVEDTGTGIAPAILDKIYDPFFTTKPVGQGTGLGLSTTLGIVRSHAGFIQVRTAPGQGTLFRVFLPVSVETGSTAAAAPVLLPARQGHGELVLVVDDEEPLRHIARQILESNGYRVLEAEDGTEALRLLQCMRELPQVLLTDLLMPRMDGPALIRLLRQLPVPIKVIAMSGLPQPPETLQALGLTAQAFLPKPFDAPTLLRALQTVVA